MLLQWIGIYAITMDGYIYAIAMDGYIYAITIYYYAHHEQ